MNLTLDGGTAQQRNWFSDAVAKAVYDWDHLTANVTVTWPEEPSLPGHQESACTHTLGSESAIEMRRNLDDPDVWPDGKPFYQETAIHELAHVMCFTFLDESERQAMCPWFFKDRIGSGKIFGTAEDLNPLDKPWEDRIQEAMAEILKDTFLPERFRASDNRTYWKIDPAYWQTFVSTFVGVDTAGGYSEVWRDSNFFGGDSIADFEPIAPEPDYTHFFTAPQSQFGAVEGRIRIRTPAGYEEWGALPVPAHGSEFQIQTMPGSGGWALTNGPADWSETWVWSDGAWVPQVSGGTPIITDSYGSSPAVISTVHYSAPVDAPEFPYKDSTVGSGGNDAAVIRLGSSLMS